MLFFHLGFMTYREGLEWPFYVWIWDNYVHILTASFVFATLLTTYVYVASFYTGEMLAEHGNTGNHIYDVIHIP